MIDVTILLLQGGHASTAIGPLEVFRSAGTLWNALTGIPPEPRFHVRTAAIGRRPVAPEGPIEILASEDIAQIARTDLVFVPSVGLDVDAALAANAEVIELVRRAHRDGARVAGVCSGVALLAQAGLLDGRIATTHPGLATLFAARFPRVDWQVQHVVTEANGVYCGGGVYAALDLALHLVERLCDHEVAARSAQALQIEMPRPCQAGFALLPMSRRHTDASIERAEEWIHRHCSEEIRFNALARALGMSPRNFMRRFKAATGLPPTDYLQGLRVNAARRLLEDEHVTVQEVGAAVGYEDGAFFRSVFKRHTGVAPGEYRRALAGSSPALAPRAAVRKKATRQQPPSAPAARPNAPARPRRNGATR